ncbi:hypothetical protein ACWDRB_67205 [Nonomuraea sp. NPDC003707]
MNGLSDAERAQFAGVLRAIRTGGAQLESSRTASRDSPTFSGGVLPDIDDVTIGRVLHRSRAHDGG